MNSDFEIHRNNRLASLLPCDRKFHISWTSDACSARSTGRGGFLRICPSAPRISPRSGLSVRIWPRCAFVLQRCCCPRSGFGQHSSQQASRDLGTFASSHGKLLQVFSILYPAAKNERPNADRQLGRLVCLGKKMRNYPTPATFDCQFDSRIRKTGCFRTTYSILEAKARMPDVIPTIRNRVDTTLKQLFRGC